MSLPLLTKAIQDLDPTTLSVEMIAGLTTAAVNFPQVAELIRSKLKEAEEIELRKTGMPGDIAPHVMEFAYTFTDRVSD